MNLFLRNLKTSLNARERELAIKENLLSNLSENAKEIQFESNENPKEYLEQTDCTDSLCTTLEAFFLHGLKDSFLWQTIRVIGGDVDRRPEPNFWNPLLIFMHKQTIEKIYELSYITSEVGYCRSWIRLSLNESLLSSYLNIIRKHSSALSSYYKKYALLKDTDTLEVAAKILEGIEAAGKIKLPINSALLNRWPDYTLQMAGVWTPPLRSCPIVSGVDVASSLTDIVNISIPQPLQCNEIFSDSISSSPFNQSVLRATGDLTDNEHLQLFLQKIDEIENSNTNDDDKMKMNESSESFPITEVIASIGITSSPVNDQSIGNSLGFRTSWSGQDMTVDENTTNDTRIVNSSIDTTIINNNDQMGSQCSRSNSITPSISSLKSPNDNSSFNTLLVKHRKIREQDGNDSCGRFESSLNMTNDSGVVLLNKSSNLSAETNDNQSDVDSVNIEGLGFEIVPQWLSEKFTSTELQQMFEHACKLAREPGLDSQGFICKLCAHPLGFDYATPQVCAFSGYYYCEKCISDEQFSIPAKIIYNWDFRKYPVSKNAAAFMKEFQYQPFIDLKLLNPDIYSAAEDMASLQSLRIQLNFIRAYLFTCCQPIIEGLQKQVWPRDYLYEHIHRYSIDDLKMIQHDNLGQILQKAVAFGEHHIINCPLCSVKGFICEICNSPKVLYPFHIDTTFRCKICGAVFHDQCLNGSQPCPKCERKRKREDLPLLEAVHML